MKDLREREAEARARLAERLARLRAERRLELARRRPGHPPRVPLPRVEPEAREWWWDR
jgi:hypothetical protein